MTREEIENRLAQCTCSEQVYRHWSRQFKYSDGVKTMADLCGAHWLLDIVGSYQPKCQKDAMLREMQVWVLKVDLEKHTAVVECYRDRDDLAFSQVIEYTDFKLPEMKLWMEGDVLILPSEH